MEVITSWVLWSCYDTMYNQLFKPRSTSYGKIRTKRILLSMTPTDLLHVMTLVFFFVAFRDVASNSTSDAPLQSNVATNSSSIASTQSASKPNLTQQPAATITPAPNQGVHSVPDKVSPHVALEPYSNNTSNSNRNNPGSNRPLTSTPQPNRSTAGPNSARVTCNGKVLFLFISTLVAMLVV